MNFRASRFWTAGWVSLLASCFWAVPPAGAQSLQPVSTVDRSLGPPSGAGGDSGMPILTPDGRYVLFASSAENLLVIGTNGPVPPRLNRPLNVYLRDRLTAATTLSAWMSPAARVAMPTRFQGAYPPTANGCCSRAWRATSCQGIRITPRMFSSGT